MSLVRSEYNFNCQSEKKKEPAYHIQCMYYMIFLLEFCLHKMSLGFVLKQKVLTSKFAKSRIYNVSSLEDDSITCGEISDESSLDSSSECSSSSMTLVELEEEKNCEVYFAASIIQNTCSEWIEKVKARKQVELELRASQTVINALRKWSLKMKVKRERDAIVTIQSNWREYHEKQRRARAIEEKKMELVRRRNVVYGASVVVFSHLLLHTYFS